MFKNAILYKVMSFDEGLDVESCLQQAEFHPCGAGQEKSSGWVPPREAHGPMIESIGGQKIMKLMTETKAIPADVINRKTAERCAEQERMFGRKPGKRETRDIKDDIRLELLPVAFSKQSTTLVWFDPALSVILVDASSQAKADDVVSALVQSLPGLTLSLINTKVSPAAAMADWLVSQEAPQGFSVDRECELKACDESKAVVKYGKHRLDIDEVKDHITTGKMPTKLALTWSDRVSFVLTEGLQLKKLAFLDVVVFSDSVALAADNFDANVIIATGELRKMLPDLLEALGGEVKDHK